MPDTPAVHPPNEPVDEALGFRFRHGPVARSLADFHDILRSAPADVVAFHRDHFVPWVRDVLREAPLARRLDAYAQAGMAPALLRETLADLVAARLEGRLGA